MKTPEELNALKAELEALNGKLAELNDDELTVVAGGAKAVELIEVPESPIHGGSHGTF